MTVSARAAAFRLSLAMPVALTLGVGCALLASMQPLAVLIAMARGIGLGGLAYAGPMLPILIAGIGAVAITFPILLAFGLGRVPLRRAARHGDADRDPASRLRAGAYPPPTMVPDSAAEQPRRPFSAATELELELSSDQMVADAPDTADPESTIIPTVVVETQSVEPVAVDEGTAWPAISANPSTNTDVAEDLPAEAVVDPMIDAGAEDDAAIAVEPHPAADEVVQPVTDASEPAPLDPEPVAESAAQPDASPAPQGDIPALPAGLIARKGKALPAPLPDDYASDAAGDYIRPRSGHPVALSPMTEPEMAELLPATDDSEAVAPAATDNVDPVISDDDSAAGIDAPVINPVGAELAELAARFPAAMPEDGAAEFMRAPDVTGPPIGETVRPIEQSVVRRGHPLRTQSALPGATDAEEEEMNTKLNSALGSLKRLVARR